MRQEAFFTQGGAKRAMAETSVRAGVAKLMVIFPGAGKHLIGNIARPVEDQAGEFLIGAGAQLDLGQRRHIHRLDHGLGRRATRSGMAPVKSVVARSTTARLPIWLTCSLTGWVSTKRKVLPSASAWPLVIARGIAATIAAGSMSVLPLKLMASTPPVVVALTWEAVLKDRRP